MPREIIVAAPRSPAARSRNLILAGIAVVALSVPAGWAILGSRKYIPAEGRNAVSPLDEAQCRLDRVQIDSAERAYKKTAGGYTDIAGLRYAGLYTDADFNGFQVKVTGPRAAGSAYELVATRRCKL